MGPVGGRPHARWGQALFPSLAETRPSASFPPRVLRRSDEAAWSATDSSSLCHGPLAPTGPHGLGGWRPIRASHGKPPAPGHAGEPRSSAPRAESRRPSLCTISKRWTVEKEWAEATVSCPSLDGGSHGPLEPETTPPVQTEVLGRAGILAEVGALCCQPGQALRAG